MEGYRNPVRICEHLLSVIVQVITCTAPAAGTKLEEITRHDDTSPSSRITRD